MAYQFIRKPLRNAEVNKFCYACKTVKNPHIDS